MPESAKRAKIRRKDLRGPDEFETLTGETVVWASHHRTTLVAGGVAILVVAAAALLIGRSRALRNEEASGQFQQAQAQLASGNAADAAARFGALEASASGTPFGRLAALYQGHALMQQGDTSGAATAYTEYLSSTPAAEYLRQQALLGLARARESAGDAPGALDGYTQAEALEGPAKADAAVGAARVLEAQGKTDDARAIYTRLVKDAPAGWIRELAETKVPGIEPDAAPPATPVVDVR